MDKAELLVIEDGEYRRISAGETQIHGEDYFLIVQTIHETDERMAMALPLETANTLQGMVAQWIIDNELEGFLDG